jgi:hypothetical protein
VSQQETKTKKKTKQKKQKVVGESLLEKRLGRLPLVTFRIVQGKKIIEPWAGKSAHIMEWMRNSSAMLGDTREEIATFWKVEQDSPIYYEDSMVADMKMAVAFFTSSKDGRHYDVAARLVPSNIKPGDNVKLEILGCCSIANVNKV